MKFQMIRQTEIFVQKELGEDATGHDWFHVDRVRMNALYIWKHEMKGDPFIIEMASLLHDIPDEKLNESPENGKDKLDSFLRSLPMPFEDRNHINHIIEMIPFKGGRIVELPSIEAKIVQDADRLDAIGAIGIARAFAYGGKKGQPIFDPAIKIRDHMSLEDYRNGKSSSIHHFYEKLLKIKDLLHTEAAIKMAKSRHEQMECFLREFYKEWNGQS